MIGTLEEAKEILAVVGTKWDRNEDDPVDEDLPEGWTYLGGGRSRSVYLAPSGVAYKICHYYTDREEQWNTVEHGNFELIEMSGKLPEKWKVPKSHLHHFRDQISVYDWEKMEPVKKEADIVVMACDYIVGQHYNYSRPGNLPLRDVFTLVGLSDTYTANAIMGDDGFNYIIDAAEGCRLPKVRETK